MKFTPEHLNRISRGIQTRWDQKEQKEKTLFHPLKNQMDAASIMKKILEFEEGGQFKEGEVEFTTTEKALILECLERPWPALFAEAVREVKEMLQ